MKNLLMEDRISHSQLAPTPPALHLLAASADAASGRDHRQPPAKRVSCALFHGNVAATVGIPLW